MEFYNKQEVIDVLSPELSSAQAEQHLPVAQGNYKERVAETNAAKVATKACLAVCDANGDAARFLRATQGKTSAERDKLKTVLRTELYELRDTCDIGANSSLLRQQSDAIEFLDSSYDFLMTVKEPSDNILYLDALENEARAEHSEASAAAALSRVKTIIALAPVIELEGGDVGLIGAATEALRDQVKVLAKRIEMAADAARNARIAYDRQLSARISRGMITTANLPHAV